MSEMNSRASRMFGASSVTTQMTGTGQEPTFPSAATGRVRANFKLVLASWKRIRAPNQADTNDFEVNVSAYGPRQSTVTRVQLVDVDISNTQFLIEPAWCRIYFDMGIRPTPTCRNFCVKASWPSWSSSMCGALSADTCLPLALDAVRSWQILPDDWVRVYMTHCAPRPMPAIVRAWIDIATACENDAVCIQFVNVFDQSQPLKLTPDNVRDTDSALAFEVHSAELITALTTMPADWQFALVAGSIPSPAMLARVLTMCTRTLLCEQAACARLRVPLIDICYSALNDTFEFRASVHGELPSMLLEGALSAYMGFGPSVRVEASGNVPPRKRVGTGECAGFCALQQGDPTTPRVLAQWIETAMNMHIWSDVTEIGVRLAGAPAFTTIAFPTGVYTLLALCEALTAALVAGGIPWLTATLYTSGTIEFSSGAAQLVFDLDLRDCTAAARLGFEQVLFSGVTRVRSSCTPCHVPRLSGPCGTGGCCHIAACTTPPACVTVSVCENRAVFRLCPLPPCAIATVDDVLQMSVSHSGSLLHVVTAVPSGFMAGMAVVAITDNGTNQLRLRVWEVHSATQLVLCAVDGTHAGFPPLMVATAVTLYASIDELALNLYLQRTPVIVSTLDGSNCSGSSCSVSSACTGGNMLAPLAWANGVDADMLGAEARTYSLCIGNSTLCLPGTLEVCQDSYILLCLAFAAGGSIPCVGNVYYPFLPGANNFRTVFAKVLRNSFLRADFDRVFEHEFPGSGMQLGYIRVLILNPNGTPYQTHGHPVSVTLKFDAWGTDIVWGDGHTVMLSNGPTPDAVAYSGAPIVPFSRGTIYADTTPDVDTAFIEEDA